MLLARDRGPEEGDEEHPDVAVLERAHAEIMASLVHEEDRYEDGERRDRLRPIGHAQDEEAQRCDEQQTARGGGRSSERLAYRRVLGVLRTVVRGHDPARRRHGSERTPRATCHAGGVVDRWVAMAEIDAEKFNEFERAGWADNSSDAYDRVFGPVTRRVIDDLLDAAGVRSETRLLDVATGPGYVAAQASLRGARDVGGDLCRQMLDKGRPT